MTPQELRAIRERLGLTQTQLADALGVAMNSIWRMENDRQAITERTAKQVRALERERGAA